eukprot:642966-Pyramimonas_sp.AAC.1
MAVVYDRPSCQLHSRSWLLAPAVGPALDPGLGARSRANSGAACASGGGAAGSARGTGDQACSRRKYSCSSAIPSDDPPCRTTYNV